MTQRCIEAIHKYFCYKQIEARTTVDLEHVQLFSEAHRDGKLDEGKTHVQLTSGTEWILDTPYDEFKTLHNAYQNSKNPQQVLPEAPRPHPDHGFPICRGCGTIQFPK